MPNHNFVFSVARGELFKWVSHDDLYARDMLKRCVDALDECPQAVLSMSWSATIDSNSTPTKLIRYPEATASAKAPERFRSMLFDGKGDYTYALIRSEALRRTPLYASYHSADRTLVTELALHGSFSQVPDWLYFRRERENEQRMSARERCVILDPRRANRLRNPAIRLYAEYIWDYIAMTRRAPLSAADRRECRRWLRRWVASSALPSRAPLGEPISGGQPLLYGLRWLASQFLPGRDVRAGEQLPDEQPNISIDALVAGRDRRLS
jgi:hypothetical protein